MRSRDPAFLHGTGYSLAAPMRLLDHLHCAPNNPFGHGTGGPRSGKIADHIGGYRAVPDPPLFTLCNELPARTPCVPAPFPPLANPLPPGYGRRVVGAGLVAELAHGFVVRCGEGGAPGLAHPGDHRDGGDTVRATPTAQGGGAPASVAASLLEAPGRAARRPLPDVPAPRC